MDIMTWNVQRATALNAFTEALQKSMAPWSYEEVSIGTSYDIDFNAVVFNIKVRGLKEIYQHRESLDVLYDMMYPELYAELVGQRVGREFLMRKGLPIEHNIILGDN